MSRQFFVCGNWKMNGTEKFVAKMAKRICSATLDKDVDVVLGCPFVYISYARGLLTDRFSIAGQNCCDVVEGGHTGEVSPSMLTDVGANFVILGHSERRQIFKESDEVIAKKVALAIEKFLITIGCIGETLAEREESKTESVLANQMSVYANAVSSSNWDLIIIAYEPVWAIGTGKSATPEQAQSVHAFLRKWLTENVSEEVANTTRIIYGGSVTAGNCRELAAQPDIDGFLVGGASLKPEFIDIINSKM